MPSKPSAVNRLKSQSLISMKQIIFSLLLLITSFQLSASSEEKAVNSNIQQVTVYKKGAQISRTAKVNLPAGQTQLKFVGLSSQCVSSSVRINGNGNLSILSVFHRAHYHEDPLETPVTLELKENVKKLEEQIKKEQVLLEIARQEERIILANQAIAGGNNNLSLVDLQAATDFYNKKMTALKLQQLELTLKIGSLREDIQKFNAELQKLNTERKKINSSEVIVTVQTNTNTQGQFSLTYFVPNASWWPSYDIKVKDVENPIHLIYKANIQQNSGEDWENVQLTLSTSNPLENVAQPTLNPWQLHWYPNGVVYRNPNYGNNTQTLSETNITTSAIDSKRNKDAPAILPLPVQVIENTTSFEYKIDAPYTIPKNNQAYMVDIQNYELPANYEYYCAPKLDKNAYLTAKVTKWEAYNLLNGQANLFFEDTYIGKMPLNVQNMEDTLSLSLGRDKNIVINRTKEKDCLTNPLNVGKKTDIRQINIEIRNKKKHPIYIVVQDQFPISKSDDVEVIRKKPKKAELDEDTGILTWKLTIPPYQKTEFGFEYSVKYPRKGYVGLE